MAGLAKHLLGCYLAGAFPAAFSRRRRLLPPPWQPGQPRFELLDQSPQAPTGGDLGSDPGFSTLDRLPG